MGILSLTRCPQQSLIVTVRGVVVNVKILQVSGNKVRVGIEAPEEVHIIREELLDKIKNQTNKED